MSVGVSYLRCQVPVEELEFWVNRLEEFSGQLIRHSAEVLEYYVCSDRGEHQIGGRVCNKGTEQVHKRTGLPQIGARGFRDLSVNTGQWGVSIQMLSLETGLRMRNSLPSFESLSWRKDNTFRGRPEFGIRIYRILTSGEICKE